MKKNYRWSPPRYNVWNNFLMMLTWCFVGFSSRLLKDFYADSDILTSTLRATAQAYVKLSTKWELISTWLPPDLIDISDNHHVLLSTFKRLINWSIVRFISLFPFFRVLEVFSSSRGKEQVKFKTYCTKCSTSSRTLRFTCKGIATCACDGNFMRKCNNHRSWSLGSPLYLTEDDKRV